ncbi:sodium:solute symporter family protein [Actinocrispum wychmicini]|uniref:SSS family solute:Na+ symporter n=1 Tax=Actinocrispum wychmicini TaxID=1213861 RepID=A0A4R2JUB1_9PSEU|nr:sodium:solute symporter family protein [Actinocrispum wychmicini]TCO62777.1 SSS family solute:Na+ symporter [Actinocrispum wychmicini]
MTVTLLVTIAGIVLIAAFGFVGRKRPVTDLAEWTVGGRRFGAVTMWFLQAGEVFTTFTFLGMAGLVFAGGVASFYALPYVPLAYIGLYFLGPMIWRRARARGHLTQSDFLADFYESRPLGVLVAIFGVVFLLPYLQLQITGLGLAVQLATGNTTSGSVSIVIAFVLTVAFVLWSGIRGVASTSYFKDVIMIVVLFILVVAIPAHFTGGIGATFKQILATRPDILRIHAGTYDSVWFFTSMVASAIGVLFMTLPHQWPALMSAASPRALRRNYVFLPAYSIALALPMIIGFTGVLVLPAKTTSNGVLLALTNQAFPAWFVGIVVVATAATAMVPAAGLIIAMSSVIARNIAPVRTERGQFRVNQVSVVVVTGLALTLGLTRPDLLANLLLLTFSGLDQLIPAIGLALLPRRLVGTWPVVAGLLVGEAIVIWLTFGTVYSGHVNVGIVALAPNLAIVGIGAVLERVRRSRAVGPVPVAR